MRLFLLLALVLPVAAQVAQQANDRYRTEQGRAAVARGLARSERDAEQRPRELVAALALKPGMTVADIGTGVGYLLPFLSEAVGQTGHVIAEDIFPDFLAQAREKARTSGLRNVTFVLGTDTDAALPAGSAEVALVLDVYHHFDYPARMLASLSRGLRAGGHLVIVDYYKTKDSMPGGDALQHIRLSEADVIAEVEKNGFRLRSQAVHNPGRQYLLTFEKQ